MKFLCKISFAFLTLTSALEAKVSIFSHYYGQPEFVKYQHLFFEKNLLDEYEFVIFEDSRDENISKQIQTECEKYGITYFHIPRSVFETPKLPTGEYFGLHAPSFECAVATQYIYDNFVIPSQNICVIMDNDIFLLSHFSIEKFAQDYAFSYVSWEKNDAGDAVDVVEYMLPNFLILNPPIMPEKESLDFNLGTILGSRTDSGGQTYHYLKKYKFMGQQISMLPLWFYNTPLKTAFSTDCPLLFNSQEWRSHYFAGQEAFLHIRMGSNWSNHPRYNDMRREISHLFNELLKQ